MNENPNDEATDPNEPGAGNMHVSTPYPDEATDPDPATIPTNIDGDPAGGEHPGAPDAEELAADRNLFPGAEKPLSDDAPEESGDHTEEG